MLQTSSKFFKKCQERKAKRYRSAFTTEQINYLEGQFKQFSYIGSEKRKEIANILKISERAVKIWFQNRRMKEKRENGHNKEIQIEHKNHINKSDEQLNSSNVYLNNECAINEQLLRSQCQNKHLKAINTETIKPNCTSNKKNNLSELLEKCTNNVYLPENKCNNKVTGNIIKCEDKSVVEQKARSVTTKIPAISLIREHLEQFSDVNQEFKNESMSSMPALVEKDDLPKDVSLSNIQVDRKGYQKFYPEHLNCDPRLVPLFNHGYYVSQPVPTTTANHSGNVVWKPVSVMPVLPGIAPASSVTIDNNSPMYLTNQDVSKGICNCHGTPHLPNAGMQYVSRTHPQYVFAIPFCNSPN